MTKLGTRLREEHRALDAQFDEVAELVRAGDTATMDAGWTRLESSLIEHMDFEEKRLLPRFERVDPAAAARVREEHAAIRARLTELGIAIELHTIREAAVRAFLDELRAHATREDEALYPWADALDANERAELHA